MISINMVIDNSEFNDLYLNDNFVLIKYNNKVILDEIYDIKNIEIYNVLLKNFIRDLNKISINKDEETNEINFIEIGIDFIDCEGYKKSINISLKTKMSNRTFRSFITSFIRSLKSTYCIE